MANAKTTDIVKGKWATVFEYYKLPPITGKNHYKGACPICGKKDKFRIDDKDGSGSWICVCGQGNGWRLLTLATGKEFPALAKEIDHLFGNEYQAEATPAPKIDNVLAVKKRFMSLTPIKNSPAVEYFHNRGIYQLPRKGVRYSPGERYEENGAVIPCLYSIASNDYGDPIFKHYTFIVEGKKASVDKPRKMHTIQQFDGSVAVKLREAGAVLGIGEGIETAMSAGAVYRLPCWATLNAALMKKFRAPTGVEELYIFADNDKNGTGLAAAFQCGNANLLSKNSVTKVVIRWPKTLNDFNDFILQGDDVCEWVLTR